MRALTRLERALRGLDLEELATRRWYAGKDRLPSSPALVDAFELDPAEDAWLVVVDIGHDNGTRDRYLLPVRLEGSSLVEPPPDDAYWARLAGVVRRGAELPGLAGTLIAAPGPWAADPTGPVRQLTDDQSNTSVVIGDRLVLKCYRRILPGMHPEPELLSALAHVGSRRAPGFAGSLTRRTPGGEEALACLYAFVPGEPVGWEPFVERIRGELAGDAPGVAASLADDLAALGSAAAELHVALASALGVETATADDTFLVLERARARLGEAERVASGELASLVVTLASQLEHALADLRLLKGAPIARTHGDLHLAQFVSSPDGPVVVDFEGEPGLELEERRRPGSPLRDLACLLLSLDHAAVVAARRLDVGRPAGRALEWSAAARELVTAAYQRGIEGSRLAFDERLLRALEVEKELHEVIYAATVLPEWSYAPTAVLPRLAAGRGELSP